MRHLVLSRTPARAASRLVLLLGVISCGSADPTAPLQPCSAQVEVRVTGGAQGEISWTPRCGVSAIAVYPAPGIGLPSTMWAVSAETGGLIGPGVRYGQRPSGTQETSPALPIDANWQYQIVLTAPGPTVVGTAMWNP